jgi:tetratricopeptide (TPR) repeat protein
VVIKQYDDFEIVITEQNNQLYASLGTVPGDRGPGQPVAIVRPDGRAILSQPAWYPGPQVGPAERGHQLFRALVQGEIGDTWRQCLDGAEQRVDVGLRLRVSYQNGVLNKLPFELLCQNTDPIPDFLALRSKTPIVRSLGQVDPVQDCAIELPLRMLIVIANPVLQVQGDPIAERDSLEEAFADLPGSEVLQVDYLGLPGYPTADYASLQRAVTQTGHPYDAVHFVGHGDLSDAQDAGHRCTFLLVDPQTQRRQNLRAADLIRVLVPNGIKVATFQACQGAREGTHGALEGLAGQLAASALPATMAMQCSVGRDAAAWFYAQFYRFWLAEGDSPIERAVTEARQASYHRFGKQSPAWWSPVLYTSVRGSESVRIKTNEQQLSVPLSLDLSDVLCELGQVDEAVARLVSRATLLQAIGDQEEALAACERALEISPQEPTASRIQAEIWLERGDTALAEDDLDLAVAAYRRSGADDKIALAEKKRRQRGYKALEKEASECEQARQWTRAATIYQQLLEETDDEQLRIRWEAALERTRFQVQAEAAGEGDGGFWTAGYVLDDKYEITSRMAVTATSQVYLAKETQPPFDTVVVKRLKPEKMADERAYSRFTREIGILRKIGAETVLLPFGSRTMGENCYFVTEFADKGTLQEYLASKPDHRLKPIEAIQIAQSVCRGLEAAHRHGIVHRDVKPGNIFLFSQSDGSTVAKLADFNIARLADESTDTINTDEGTFIGTFRYASPEQVGGVTADQRSDLYSWALVLFEMLTGQSVLDTIKDQLTLTPVRDEFPASFFVERAVPPRLAPVLKRCLYTDRERRYGSVEIVREILEQTEVQLKADAQRCLNEGEEHLRAQEWQSALRQFEQGLELCEWHGDSCQLAGPLADLAERLQRGRLCASGMMHLDGERWQAAIDDLEHLRALAPDYLGLDIAAQLRHAKSELEREQKVQDLVALREQENWTDILRLTVDLSTSYEGGTNESIIEIRKLAMYARGMEFRRNDNLERAYFQFHRLYERDPDYEDVAELCAGIAYSNAMRDDIPLTLKHQIEWLEKVLQIEPEHRYGRTCQRLNQLRHRWARELIEEGSDSAALYQLERITDDYEQWTEVCQTLARQYYRLGQVEGRDDRWRDAEELWQRALEMTERCPSDAPDDLFLPKSLRRQIRHAKWRAFLQNSGPAMGLFGLIIAILSLVAGIIQVWPPRTGRMPTATPTPAIVAPASATVTIAATHTALPSATVVPALTPTPIPTPYPAPSLLAPDDGARIEKGHDVTLEWEWSEEPTEAEFFRVSIRRQGDPSFEHQSPTKFSQYVIPAGDLEPSQTYEWQVAVISLPEEEKAVSGARSFTYLGP